MRHILSFDIAKGKSVYCFIDELRNVIIDASLIEHKAHNILQRRGQILYADQGPRRAPGNIAPVRSGARHDGQR